MDLVAVGFWQQAFLNLLPRRSLYLCKSDLPSTRFPLKAVKNHSPLEKGNPFVPISDREINHHLLDCQKMGTDSKENQQKV